LTQFSPATVLVGALVLAGLLFLLQRLRVRRQVVRVPTSMFWRMAVQAAPARVLHERFRHWLAYALVLSIALLLWLAASGLQMAPGSARKTQLFYLDASAAMTAAHAFDDAAAALIADACAVPADRREVVLGDPYGTLLLARGEDIALLPARLKEVKPGLYPSAFPAWVGARAGLLKAAPLPALHYYGARGGSGWFGPAGPKHGVYRRLSGPAHSEQSRHCGAGCFARRFGRVGQGRCAGHAVCARGAGG
jgi:hypothetical protein